ncbi:MAG: hypothetical protein EBT63_06990, partial [Proteobacteria bacterium]|nr:hypothetical protein [Pseudomonadota bacterium]
NNQKIKTKNYAQKIDSKSLSIKNPVAPTLTTKKIQAPLAISDNFSAKPLNSNQFQGKDFIEKSSIKSPKKSSSTNSESLTSGNYIGVDFIKTDMSFREVWLTSDNLTLKKPFSTDSKNSFGIKYMYALNFNKLFIAPEIFYEKTNIKKQSDLDGTIYDVYKQFESYGYRWLDIESRMGAKLNLGYDVNPYFAPYFFAGYSLTKYRNLWSSYLFYDTYGAPPPSSNQEYFTSQYGQSPFSIKNGNAGSPFYGFGAKIKISSRFFLNTEYIAQNFKIKTGHKRILNDRYTDAIYPDINSNKVSINTRLQIFKIGLAYNF